MHSQPAPSVAARLAAGRFSRWSLAVLSLAPFAAAQLGNEVVFVGSSTSGNVDRHHFVESATGTVVAADGVAFTDNVTAAVWADTGRRLYVAQSLQNRVSLAEWSGAQATWSTFHAAAGPCYGLGFDRARQRLWVLAGNSGSAELLGLDADPASVGYGQTVAQTSTLAGVQRERWALSWSGNLALVPGVFLSSPVDVVDLDPASGTYLQVIASLFVPGLGGSFAFTSSCEVSVDDRYLYLLYAGIPGTQGLAVHDLWTQAWLDFDAAPGQQHLARADDACRRVQFCGGAAHQPLHRRVLVHHHACGAGRLYSLCWLVARQPLVCVLALYGGRCGATGEPHPTAAGYAYFYQRRDRGAVCHAHLRRQDASAGDGMDGR